MWSGLGVFDANIMDSLKPIFKIIFEIEILGQGLKRF
jgi:hypothetical protein